MSAPFVPHRIIGGSVLAAESASRVDAYQRTPGVELLGVDPLGGEPSADPGSIYRAPARGRGPSHRWVEICEPLVLYDEEPGVLELFGQMVSDRIWLGQRDDSPPRVLQVLGRDGQSRAMVVEQLRGVSLETLVGGLHDEREYIPIEIALAVADVLVRLFRCAGSMALLLGAPHILLSADGRVRTRPILQSEHERRQVGAAVLLSDEPLKYIAPEALFKELPSERSGLYAVGMLLYEMLAGHLPFAPRTATFIEVVHNIKAGKLVPLGTLRADLPAALTDLVDKAVARDPEMRFESWPELSECLAAVRSSFAVAGPTEVSAWLRSIPKSQRPLAPPRQSFEWPTDWRALPHCGYVPIEPPQLPPTGNPIPAPRVIADPDFVYPAPDRRPMLAHGSLLVDVRPVTEAEYQRFMLATSGVEDGFARERAKTELYFEQAQAYARWAEKRLPTDEEWTALVEALGAEALGVGEVWEWTATPKRGGHVVRGGRWRDAWLRPPVPANRSHETDRAPDVGFRCVRER